MFLMYSIFEKETITTLTLDKTVLMLLFGGLFKKTYSEMNNFGGVNSNTFPQTLTLIVLKKVNVLMFHCIVNIAHVFYVGFTCNGHKDRTDIHFKSK